MIGEKDMKKRILAVLLSIGCLLSLGGCSDNPTETNRFISTNETIIISGGTYEIVYDNYTKIVYLSSCGDYDIEALLGADKQPMTIDEYYKQK
jgi:hypothetical protein